MNTHTLDRFGVERFVAIAKHNLLALERSLRNLGYEFADSAGPVQFTDDESLAAVHELETRVGKLPELYRKWYETFRSVDFSQDEKQLRNSSEGILAGLGLNCVLVFRDIRSCLRLQHELSQNNVRVRRTDGAELIPFGSSASNCEPKGIWVPSLEIDPVIYDDGGGPITMSREIIGAFEFGGFPFWARLLQRRRFTSPIGFAPSFSVLLPKLKHDQISFTQRTA